MFRSARSRALLIPFIACAAFALTQAFADGTTSPGQAAEEGHPVYTGADFVFNGQTYCQGEWRSNGGATVGDRCYGNFDPNHVECVWPTPAFDYRMWSRLKSLPGGCAATSGWSANTSSQMLPHYITVNH